MTVHLIKFHTIIFIYHTHLPPQPYPHTQYYQTTITTKNSKLYWQRDRLICLKIKDLEINLRGSFVGKFENDSLEFFKSNALIG